MNASAKRSLSRRNPLPTLFGDQAIQYFIRESCHHYDIATVEYRGVHRRALTTAQTVHREGCPK